MSNYEPEHRYDDDVPSDLDADTTENREDSAEDNAGTSDEASADQSQGFEFEVTAEFDMGKLLQPEADESQSEVQEVAVENPLQGITVYVVDDDQIILNTHSRIIQANGGEAVTNSSAQACLEMLPEAEGNIVILTDYQMPEMSGLEFAKQVRLLEGRKAIPIILVSGGGFDELEVDAALASRIIDVLVIKPIDSNKLGQLIRKIFDNKKNETSS